MLGMRRGLPSSLMRADAEVAQDLRADAVGAQVPLRGRRAPAPRRSGATRSISWPALSRAVEQHDHAASLPRRCAASASCSGHECAPRPASSRSSTRQRLVHAHQHLVAGLDLAAHQRQVQSAAGAVAIGDAAGTRRAACSISRSATRSISDLVAAAVARSGRRWCRSSGRARARTRPGRAGAPSCRRPS